MTDPSTPPVESAAPGPGSVVRQLLDADWAAVGAAVAPILLALAVGAQLAALTAWVAGAQSSTANGVGAYLSVLTMIACATFFAGIGATGGDAGSDGFNININVHAVPLGVTLLVLTTARFAVKRSGRGDRRERTAFAAQVSLVVALVVLGLALLSRIDAGLGDGTGTVHADAAESFLGALGLLLVVTVSAARDAERWVLTRLGSWVAPVRGAVSGLVIACLLGFLGALIAVVVTVVADGGSLLDVLRGVPLALAFLPNIGLAFAHVALLGTLDASFATFLSGGGGGIGLLHRHGAPAWYWLLVVIAPIVIAVAIVRALRAAQPVDVPSARRVACRTAVPLALGWMLLGIAARLRAGTFGVGSAIGPTAWQSIVLPALWALALGYPLAGPLRHFAGPRAPRPARRPVQLGTLCLGFIIASALLAAGAAAGARQSGEGQVFGWSSAETTVPPTAGDSMQVAPSADLEALARDVQVAERSYRSDHGRYTTDLAELRDYGLTVPAGVDWSAGSTGDEVCAVVSEGTTSWTFDSSAGESPVQPGDRC